MTQTDVILRVEGLETHYGNIRALKGVSFDVRAGEIVCLIGANGAGKTTTLKTICGLLKPTNGRIFFKDSDITMLPAHEIVKLGIAMVPEGRQVFSRMNVEENLQMGAYSRVDGEAIKVDIEQMFTLFPRLLERRRQPAGTLSGGEQQMLAIARALMAKPSLLLLDEPSMGLAPILLENIFDKVREINRSGTTILLVEQNTLLALSVADRGYVMQTGEINLTDSAEALKRNELVKKTYLGID